ncbi:hypothetical protein J2W96_001316 [Variovorax guangxiensis]|nr:hypothetical protein [Variovorax guangxiensis]
MGLRAAKAPAGPLRDALCRYPQTSKHPSAGRVGPGPGIQINPTVSSAEGGLRAGRFLGR